MLGSLWPSGCRNLTLALEICDCHWKLSHFLTAYSHLPLEKETVDPGEIPVPSVKRLRLINNALTSLRSF
jgi:hypothetical protein